MVGAGFPAMQRSKAGEIWMIWVGTWIGMDLAPGQERKGTMRLTLPGGPTDMPSTLRHHGAAPQKAGAIRLELETVLDSEPYRQAIARSMALVCRNALARDPADPCASETLASARRVNTLEAVSDAKTLRPFSARAVQVNTFVVEGKTPVIQHEERTYDFSWAQASRGTGSR
jgi:hypothetical protein